MPDPPALAVTVDTTTGRATATLPDIRAAVAIPAPSAVVLGGLGPQGPPGVGILLLENGAPVPPGTPAGTVIFEKA